MSALEREHDAARRAALLAGLRPWEFDRLTPDELALLLEGDQARREEQLEVVAWAVAHLINRVARKLTRAETMAGLLGPAWLARDLARAERRRRRGEA